jgi:two-component system, chemotaxis family, protein-glutamate methylesterase/glutaminase
MPGRDIITVGASAGGVEALGTLVAGLPGDLPASVFVTLHVPSHGGSSLPQILSKRGPLPAEHARDGQAIEPARIYVAPPDQHLLIHEGIVRLSRGPRENGVRPAIDALFRTAARWYGPRVVGVVLSGTLDDGAAGLLAIKERGGIAVVQDPDDALFPWMPRAAMDTVLVDHVLPAPGISELLGRLAVNDPARDGDGDGEVSKDMEIESAMAEFDLDAIQGDDRPGTPSGFACPDCAGVLWEIHDGEMVRYRCRVGHAWSPNSLLAEQTKSLEVALWTAFRALEERAALAGRTADRFRSKGREGAALRFEAQAKASRERSAVIRQVLVQKDLTAEMPREPDEEEGTG